MLLGKRQRAAPINCRAIALPADSDDEEVAIATDQSIVSPGAIGGGGTGTITSAVAAAIRRCLWAKRM
jgi:hypothetical protein